MSEITGENLENQIRDHRIAETSKLQVLEVLRPFFPILLVLKWKFLLGLSLILVATGIEVVSPLVIGKIVDLAASKAQAPLLVWACVGFLTLIVFRAVFEFFQAWVIQLNGQTLTHELRTQLFEKVVRLPVATLDQNPTGRLLSRVIGDVRSLSELFTTSISILLLDVLTIVGTCAVMCWAEPRLALSVLIWFPGVVWSVHYFGQKLAVAYRDGRRYLSEMNGFLAENISGLATIQRLGAEEQRFDSFQRISMNHQNAQMRTIRYFGLVQPFSNVLNGLSMSCLMLYGGKLVFEGQISVGLLVAYFGYVRNLYQPIRDLIEKYNTFLSAWVAAERVARLFKEPVELSSSKSQVDSHLVSSKLDIVFKNVDFNYPTRKDSALRTVSFQIPEGSSLAVVGPTGSGKSTLLRLLLRFYEPTQGQILVGGRSLAHWPLELLRKKVGVIHQENYIFRGTVSENLTLGATGFSEAQLIENCKRAQLWNLIQDRGGLNLFIEEGGGNLSAGEKQLLAFARFLVVDPPILILDEATSSIDRITERELMKGMREVLSGRTSLIIAHRLSTIESCDQVIVMKNGQIIESGEPKELLATASKFAEMWRLQSV